MVARRRSAEGCLPKVARRWRCSWQPWYQKHTNLKTGLEITVPFKWFHDTPDCHSRLEADTMTDKALVRKWTEEIGEVQTPFVDKASVDVGWIPFPALQPPGPGSAT